MSALRAALETAPEDSECIVYLLSEFRSGSAPLELALPVIPAALAEKTVFMAAPPAAATISNVQIESIRPVRSVVLANATDGSGRVTVRLARRSGSLDREVTRVAISGDGVAPMKPKVVQWEPGQDSAEVDFMLSFSVVGDREVAITASIDPDALPADDERHAILALRDAIQIAVIDRQTFGGEGGINEYTAGQWIRRALEPLDDGPIEVITIEPAALEPIDLRGMDVVISPRPDLLGDRGWNVLSTFVDRGGLLMVTPPASLNVHRWVDRFVSSLRLPWEIGLEVEEFVEPLRLADEQPGSQLLHMISSELAGLCAPVLVTKALPFAEGDAPATSLLNLADGRAILVAATPQASDFTDERSGETTRRTSAGLVVYWAVSPELSWTNLPAKPLMLPLCQEIVRQGVSMIRTSQRILVGDQMAMPWGGTARELVDADGRHLAIDQTGRPVEPIARAGLYSVNDAAGEPVGMVAVNVESSAGRTEVQPSETVRAWLRASAPWTFLDAGDPGAPLRTAASGSSLAGVLLMALLALVVIETALARWFSHALTSHSASIRGGLHPTVAEAAGGAS